MTMTDNARRCKWCGRNWSHASMHTKNKCNECRLAIDRDRKKEAMKQPHVRARRRYYLREYFRRPNIMRKGLVYENEYWARPENKARLNARQRAYNRTPHRQAKAKLYGQRHQARKKQALRDKILAVSIRLRLDRMKREEETP